MVIRGQDSGLAARLCLVGGAAFAVLGALASVLTGHGVCGGAGGRGALEKHLSDKALTRRSHYSLCQLPVLASACAHCRIVFSTV